MVPGDIKTSYANWTLPSGQGEIYKALSSYKPLESLHLSEATSVVGSFSGVNYLYIIGGPQRMHMKGWIAGPIAFISIYYKTGK